MRPADKVLHEEKTYHRSCLEEMLESNRSTSQPADANSKNDFKNETSTKSPVLSTNDLNDSDQFYEVVNDKLSLRSTDDNEPNASESSVHNERNTGGAPAQNDGDANGAPADHEHNSNEEPADKAHESPAHNELNAGDKIVIKVECCSQDRSDSPEGEKDSESNQLKSVSSNLSSLNPFDDDEDAADEFYDMDSSVASDRVVNPKTEEQSQAETKNYPKDLNPFGSEDEEEEDLEKIDKQELERQEADKLRPQSKQSMASSKDYPEELNPFDENDETIEELDRSEPLETVKPNPLLLPKNYSTSSLERYNGKPNPAAGQFKSFSNLRANRNSFNQNYDTLSVRSLTPDGKWKSNKKRQAPKPPVDPQASPIVHHSSSVNSTQASLHNASSSNTSSPILNRNPASYRLNSNAEQAYHSSQSLSENEKDSLVSLTNSDTSESRENVGGTQPRRLKKNKAPQLPTLIRFVTSIEEIERECDTIGDNLLVNSNAIREIEVKLMDNKESKQLSRSQIKKLVYEFNRLVETKCSLAKRQAELMFMKSQNRLVNDQIEVEASLRLLYQKGAKSKTFEDLKVEEDLLEKLVDIVDRKNEIEENIVRIDKSFEFDRSVQKIREYVDGALFDSIAKDYKSNYLVQSNIRNNLMADVEVKKKKHDKSKGLTLKKLSKTIHKIV